MASMTQRRIRVVNPGKRRTKRNAGKRKMSLKQLLHFGTKRQRTAAKTRLHRKRNVTAKRRTTSVRAVRAVRRKARKRNVGQILTVLPGIITNPGRKRRTTKRRTNKGRRIKRNMATAKQLRALAKARRARRAKASGRKSNPGRRRYTHRRRGVNVARRRRRNVSVARGRRVYSRKASRGRRRSYHRNPGITSGTTGKVLGVIGGATLTKLLVGFVPASFTQGFLGYIAIGAVAFLQGKAVGKVSKNASLGQDFVTGGLVYLAIKMLNDFIPSLGGNLGLSGGRGMGLIAPSSFYVPQANTMNSMGSFVRPSMVPAPYVPPVTSGMGNVRRMGRVR